METLEVVAAYTLTADGQRHDVAPDRIYTQESYSSATAPLYADRKVRVIVFSNLAPGSRVVYELRRTQNTPYFPDYFGLWETFSVFDQFDDAEVTLQAPPSCRCISSRAASRAGTNRKSATARRTGAGIIRAARR